jgi:quinol monooxygenase YgiN
MAIYVTLEIQFKPGLAAQILEGFKKDLQDTRKYNGCQGIELLQDSDNPDHILLYEHWDSKEHQLKYWQWRLDSGTMNKMGDLLAAPPVFKYYNSKGSL